MQAKLLLIVIEYLFTGLLKFHIEGYICLDSHLKNPDVIMLCFSPLFPPPAKPVCLWTPPYHRNTTKARAVLTLTPCAGDYPNVESFNPNVGRGRWALYPPAGFFWMGVVLRISYSAQQCISGRLAVCLHACLWGVRNESNKNLFFLYLVCWVTSFVQF